MQAIAFYLPQYHAIPENDAWWGKGFTEWNNVKKAIPLYPGHYQPHIPSKHIGYYDLSDTRTLVKQHALAFRYGISAFCYYYYNFSGLNPLEKPLLLINENQNIQNSFCLCWANHDWTRVWYGQKKKILLKQQYTRDNANLIIKDVQKYFFSNRYIKVNNKPVFLVFNPEENPIMSEYSDIWREEAGKNGFDGLYLIAVEALTMGADPGTYHFDAALEFAPDWSCTALLSDQDHRPRIFDYQATVKKMLHKALPPYTRFRCVFPGWDNTPRYKERGVVFGNTSFGVFKYALEHAIGHTRRHLPEDMPYVFINAWNEWGEGCHLEPDNKNGLLPLKIIHEIFSRNTDG
jgi:lipopolysaccharide biosynthesis protein